MEGSSLERLSLSAMCLIPTFCAAMLPSGCGASYHICPADITQDPSHPFAPCKTTAPAQPQGQRAAPARRKKIAPNQSVSGEWPTTASRPTQSLSGREPLLRSGRLHVFVEAGAMCDCETTWTGSRAWQAPPSGARACQSSDVTAVSAQQGCSSGICRSIFSSGD